MSPDSLWTEELLLLIKMHLHQLSEHLLKHQRFTQTHEAVGQTRICSDIHTVTGERAQWASWLCRASQPVSSWSVVSTVTVTGPVSCLTWRGAALLLWTSACSSVWTYTWKHMNSSCNTGVNTPRCRHSASLRTFLQSVWATRASLSIFTSCLTKLCKLLLKSSQQNFVSSPQAALFDHLFTFYW